jgi:hypothetical protein
VLVRPSFPDIVYLEDMVIAACSLRDFDAILADAVLATSYIGEGAQN